LTINTWSTPSLLLLQFYFFLTAECQTEEEKLQFLQAYSQSYLKEEIWMEQFIKKFDPFRRFLEVSAQCNGQIINFANLSLCRFIAYALFVRYSSMQIAILPFNRHEKK